MHRAASLMVCVLTVFALTGCGASNQPRPDTSPPAAPTNEITRQPFTIYGPNGSRFAFDLLKPVFDRTGLPYDIRILEGQTGEAGQQGILDGTFDLMITSGNAPPDEPLTYIEYIRTALVFYVHPDTGIDNLAGQQIRAIFSGEIANWSQIGSTDLEIVVFCLSEHDPLTSSTRRMILDKEPFAASARMLEEEDDMLSVVEGLPGAIGYTTLSGRKYQEIKRGQSFLSPINIDDLSPGDPTYPYWISVGVAFLPAHQAFVEPFIDWADRLMSSDFGQAIIQDFGITLTRPGVTNPVEE